MNIASGTSIDENSVIMPVLGSYLAPPQLAYSYCSSRSSPEGEAGRRTVTVTLDDVVANYLLDACCGPRVTLSRLALDT
jgi:hypothetical protein